VPDNNKKGQSIMKIQRFSIWYSALTHKLSVMVISLLILSIAGSTTFAGDKIQDNLRVNSKQKPDDEQHDSIHSVFEEFAPHFVDSLSQLIDIIVSNKLVKQLKLLEDKNDQLVGQIELYKESNRELERNLAEQHKVNKQNAILLGCIKDVSCRKLAVSLPLGDNVALEIVYVEGGTFKMGTEESDIEGLLRESENEEVMKELPAHEVTNPGFYIGKYEVTNEQYELFLVETGKNRRKKKSASTNWDKLPVNDVSLNDAKRFTNWLIKELHLEVKLPSEEEWEWAARGAQNSKYPWGDETPAQNGEYGRWGDLKGGTGTVKVGCCALGKSWCGAFDMSGNVSEWVENYYYAYPDDNSKQSEKKYVSRGGSYASKSVDVRTASRYVTNNDTGKPVVGFRILVQLCQ
jgi:formylglycine-generating enzyme required for sulfatase activity